MVRGSTHSPKVNALFGCRKRARTATINVHDVSNNVVKRYRMSDACINRVDNGQGGAQIVTFTFSRMTVD